MYTKWIDFSLQIGTTFSPFIVYIGTVTGYKGLPTAVFGCIMVFSSIFFCFNPETKGAPLVQTVGELKESGRLSMYQRLKLKYSR